MIDERAMYCCSSKCLIAWAKERDRWAKERDRWAKERDRWAKERDR